MIPTDPLELYKHYRDNPWDFLTKCVYTLDQVDKNEPKKLFPDKEYLRLYCLLWLRYPLLLVPKTRRMTMSWATIGLYTWEAIFHRGRFTAFVSKKEDDANELVKRAKFIVENLDKHFPKEFIPRIDAKFNVLEFKETESRIQGFPQGADQLRQFTFSGIFGDESAFWEKAQEFYAASFPTIDGGGRMTLVSSPAPGFFKKLVHDAMEEVGDINVSDYTPDWKSPMQGVRIWQNPKNKFLVFELHYTADPTKRDPSYKESIKNSMPLQEYLREYELHWDTFAGQPVYPEFNKDLHKLKAEPKPMHGIPMLIGFDFGLTPAAVVGQYQDGQLIIFREYVEVNMGAERFVPKVIADIRLRWPEFGDLKQNWRCFIDPSGVFRNDTDESSCALVLGANGFTVIPGPIAWEDRRKAVVKFLQGLTPHGPAFQVWERGAPMIVKGFEGGYRYNEKNFDIEPTKIRPIKDQYSHPHDALQYLCSGVQAINAALKRAIPKASYTLNKENNYGRI